MCEHTDTLMLACPAHTHSHTHTLMSLVLQAGTLRLWSEQPRDQQQAEHHPIIAIQTSSTYTPNTDKVPVLLPAGDRRQQRRKRWRVWDRVAAAPRKPRGRVVGGCGTCNRRAVGVGSSLTSAAQLSAAPLLLRSTSTTLGGGGSSPSRGATGPQTARVGAPFDLNGVGIPSGLH